MHAGPAIRRTGRPVKEELVWLRSPTGLYHLGTDIEGRGRTLCGRSASRMQARNGVELPHDVGRFGCMHCYRARARWYL